MGGPGLSGEACTCIDGRTCRRPSPSTCPSQPPSPAPVQSQCDPFCTRDGRSPPCGNSRCVGCAQCSATPVPAPSAAPTLTTTRAPPSECRDFCISKGRSPPCGNSRCAGCSQCSATPVPAPSAAPTLTTTQELVQTRPEKEQLSIAMQQIYPF